MSYIGRVCLERKNTRFFLRNIPQGLVLKVPYFILEFPVMNSLLLFIVKISLFGVLTTISLNT